MSNIKESKLGHMDVTHQLTEYLMNFPDYPIVVLTGQNAVCDEFYWTYATDVKIGIDEILDCDTRYWDYDYVCNDRRDFEKEAKEVIYRNLKEALKKYDNDREPTNAEIEEVWTTVSKEHEQYWKKCIVIYADN